MSYSANLNVSPNDMNSGASSPLGALAQWNEAQKGGLANQGLALQNQQAALMLGLRGQLAGAIGVGPNGQPLPGGAVPMGGAPGGMGGGAAGGGGGAGPDPSTGLQMVSPNAVMSPFGVPAPRGLIISAVMSADPAKSMAEIYNMGRQRVTQSLTQAGDPNDPDPSKAAQAQSMTRAAAGQLYQEGWIGPQAYQQLMSDPSKSGAFIMGTASPDAHLSAVEHAGVKGMTWRDGKMVYDPEAAAGLATAGAQVAGAEAQARVGPALQEAAGKAQIHTDTTLGQIPVRNPDGSYSTQTLSESEILRRAGGGSGTGAAAAFTPGKPAGGGSAYANYIQEKEGGAPGTTNQRSSATGPHQFEDQTWLDTIKAAAPTVAAGKTDAQLLAMRNDPAWSGAMTDALADQNATALKKLNIPGTIDPQTGQPFNGALGMAHFFGAAGAGKVMGAPPNTPMTTIFPPTTDADGNSVVNPVIKANPQIADKTNSQVMSRYADDFGLKPYGSASATPAAAAGGGGGIIGAPTPTKVQEGVIAADNKRMDEDAALIKDTQTAKLRANAAQTTLLDARNRIDNAGAGSGAEWRATLDNFIATYTPAQDWIKKVTGLDFSNVKDQQVLMKEMVNLVAGTEAQQPNTRFGAQLNAYFAKGSPALNQQPQSIHEMMNNILVANQMLRDYGDAAAEHYNTARKTFQADPVSNRYTPMTDFDQSWGSQKSMNSPAVYAAAQLAINGKPYAEWKKGLSDQQVSAALAITGRADPSGARVLGPSGAWHVLKAPQEAGAS